MHVAACAVLSLGLPYACAVLQPYAHAGQPSVLEPNPNLEPESTKSRPQGIETIRGVRGGWQAMNDVVEPYVSE
jgi:hypothetical protein